jgi:murein DD-endopeptidase MepM/ murein hydrolase activator NlpD
VRRAALCCIGLLVAAAPARARGAAGRSSPPPPIVTTIPGRLVKGRLGVVRVRGAAGHRVTAVRGTAAGEPVHFHPAGRGFAALVASPIDGPDTLVLELAGAGFDSTEVRLPVAAGDYRREQLHVAEKYARPDTAAQRRIESEIAQAREVARRSHETARQWRAPFVAPRPGRITSPFGSAREFNGDVVSRHMGTDFAGAVGAPVRAANAGVVALVADFYLAGTAVYVDHGEGLVTGYFHLSRALVRQGETVKRGQIIGRVGRSGRVTGPHLHWVARYGSVSVDPASLLAVRLP